MTEVRRLGGADAAGCARRAAVSFGEKLDDEAVARWAAYAERGEVWGIGEPTLAHCRVLWQPHWFGGRQVPAQQIASLAVPPEHRGRGTATALMRGVLAAGLAESAALSVLFPATTRLYRTLGYEHAGAFNRYRIDARQAPATGPSLRPAHEEDWDGILSCHDRMAARHTGPWARPDGRWEGLRETPYHYVLDGPGGIEAYLLVAHHHAPGDWRYTLGIADWAVTSARGLTAVLGFVGRHGSLGKDATFRAADPELFALLTSEQDVELESRFLWMARGLDLPEAVAARGFPPGLRVDVSLRVEDPVMPSAAGTWRLCVEDGRGRLRPVDEAAVRLDARAVGPLYTGFRSLWALAVAGLAEGPEDALAALGAAFAGPAPVLLDFF